MNRPDGYYWIKGKAYPPRPDARWQVARWVNGASGWGGTWFSTITSSPFNDSEVAAVDGQRLLPPGETVPRDLSAVLTDYAKRLDAGEMIEGVGLAADLADAAEVLGANR